MERNGAVLRKLPGWWAQTVGPGPLLGWRVGATWGGFVRQLPGGGMASGTQQTSTPLPLFPGGHTGLQRQRLQKHLAEHLRQT